MRTALVAFALIVASLAAAAPRDIVGFEAGDVTPTAGGQDGEFFAGVDTSFSISTTTVRSGTYSLRVNCSYGSAGGGVSVTGRSSDASHQPNWVNEAMSVRFYVRFASLPASNDSEFFCWVADSAAYGASLRVTSGGALRLYRGTGQPWEYTTLISTGTATISTGVWYRINLRTNDASAWSVSVDGIVDMSGTENIDKGNQLTLGRRTAFHANTMEAFYDDFMSDTADVDVPPGQVVRLSATGNGIYTDWVDGDGGGGDGYTDLDDPAGDPAYDGTTTHVRTSSENHRETVALTDASAAAISGTINAVKTITWTRRNDVAATNEKHIIVSNGTRYESGNASPPTNLTWYSHAMVRGVDPFDGAAWTTSDIDGLEVGEAHAQAEPRELQFTAACAMVDFQPSGRTPRSHVFWWGP